jgi:hypothetical protein
MAGVGWPGHGPSRKHNANCNSRFGNGWIRDSGLNDGKILACASKRPEAFRIVFDRHFAAIHRYLERRIGPDGADELSGEVFRIAFEQRSRFRDLHGSALPWLYGIATS